MENVIKRYENRLDKCLEDLAKKDLSSVTLDEIVSLFKETLKDAYQQGYASSGLMLGDEINRPADNGDFGQIISFVIAGKTTEERVEEYVLSQDKPALLKVMETEYHRVYESAALAHAKEINQNPRLKVFKTWVTENDELVRETHIFLHGVTIPVDEYFYAIDGDIAEAPGLFIEAENNINCRCLLEFSVESIPPGKA